MRGVAGSIALSLYFYTLQNMQLASAVTLQYMQPIFSIFLARFLNNEHFNKIQLVFVAMAILGVGVVKNFDPNIDTTLAVIGVAGAVFSSLAYTSIRMLSGKVDANLIIFYFPFITLPLVTPLAIDNWVTPNMNETLVIIAMVIFTYLGQVFLTRGYQGGRMAHVGAFRYIGLIYSVVFGYFLFGESRQYSDGLRNDSHHLRGASEQ
jgi:drug/metabolite transporter (DMT)-like permease